MIKLITIERHNIRWKRIFKWADRKKLTRNQWVRILRRLEAEEEVVFT